VENKTINIGVVTKIAIALKHLRPKLAFLAAHEEITELLIKNNAKVKAIKQVKKTYQPA
jgi:hypothetical protein